MSALGAKKMGAVNGLDVDALHEFIDQVKNDRRNGMVEFKVKTRWQGQTRSETAVESYTLGGAGKDLPNPVEFPQPW